MIVSDDSNTTVVTIGAGTISPIGAPVFIFCFLLGTYCSILFFSWMLVWIIIATRRVSLVEWDLLTISLVLFLIFVFFAYEFVDY
jgi:hypothetical protein